MSILINFFSFILAIIVFFSTVIINRTNVQLNLFDKRIKIYDATIYLIQIIANHPKKGFDMNDYEDIQKKDECLNAIESARFLFNDDKDIENFLCDLKTDLLIFLSNKEEGKIIFGKKYLGKIYNSDKLGLFNKYLKTKNINDIFNIDKFINKFRCFKNSFSNLQQSE